MICEKGEREREKERERGSERSLGFKVNWNTKASTLGEFN
jgi:hypothetical protein